MRHDTKWLRIQDVIVNMDNVTTIQRLLHEPAIEICFISGVFRTFEFESDDEAKTKFQEIWDAIG